MTCYLGRFLICGLLLPTALPRGQLGAQAPSSEVGTFPEELLGGTAQFDLAVTLQGDLRGNYGPCG